MKDVRASPFTTASLVPGSSQKALYPPGSAVAVAFDFGSDGLASAADNCANALVFSNSSASARVIDGLPLNMSSRSNEVSDALVHVPCRSGAPQAVRGAL